MVIIGLGAGLLIGTFCVLYCLAYGVLTCLDQVQRQHRRRRELAALTARMHVRYGMTVHRGGRRGRGRHRRRPERRFGIPVRSHPPRHATTGPVSHRAGAGVSRRTGAGRGRSDRRSS